MTARKELKVDARYGCLTVVEETPRPGNRRAKGLHYKLVCDCGLTVVRSASSLRAMQKKGWYSSAGPCTKARQGRHLETHGGSGQPGYHAWVAARNRCTNPKHPKWPRYGGRGIQMCERWMTFENFWQDMGPTWQKGLTLDRIDNDGPYSPENCRWTDWGTQYANTSILLPVDTKTLSEALGVSRETIRSRWRRGRTLCGTAADPDRTTWPLRNAAEGA